MTDGNRARTTLLLVEDNATIRDAFCLLLEDSGYRVVVAASGDEGLQLAEREPPHLVLLDLGLPDMEGLDVVRAMAAMDALRSVPIVALTGRALEQDEDACMQAGCAGYITKPVNADQLLRLIPTYLDGVSGP